MSAYFATLDELNDKPNLKGTLLFYATKGDEIPLEDVVILLARGKVLADGDSPTVWNERMPDDGSALYHEVTLLLAILIDMGLSKKTVAMRLIECIRHSDLKRGGKVYGTC